MNTKKQSKKQENRIAKDINAKVTIASGALDFQKADVRNDEFLIEAKTTAKNFYTLNIKTWERIKEQAIKDGLRIPIMQIDLENGKTSLVVISNLDLWGLGLLNPFYVGNSFVPYEANKSYKLTGDFLTEDFPQDISEVDSYYRRLDIVMGDKYHLAILEWSDFLHLLEERDNAELEDRMNS